MNGITAAEFIRNEEGMTPDRWLAEWNALGQDEQSYVTHQIARQSRESAREGLSLAIDNAERIDCLTSEVRRGVFRRGLQGAGLLAGGIIAGVIGALKNSS